MELLCRALSLLEVNYTRSYLKEVYDSCPDRTNLKGYSSILSFYGINTQVYQIESSEYLFPDDIPCIIFYKSDFALLEAIDSEKAIICTGGKKLTVDRETFNNSWDGLLMTLKKQRNSEEPFYDEHLKNKKIRVLCSIALIISLLFIIITSSFNNPLVSFLDYALSFSGLFISRKILIKHYGDEVKEDSICSRYKFFDCNIRYKIFKHIDVSALNFSFFLSAIVVMMLKGPSPVFTLFVCATIPFVIWSIIYQTAIKKKYCPYCLLTSVILVAMIFFNCYIQVADHVFNIEIKDILLIIGAFLLSFSLTELVILPGIKKKGLEGDRVHNLSKMKRNYLNEVRDAVWDVETSDFPRYCINVGSSSLKNSLLVVLNPFCRPCASSFIKAYNMICNNSELRISFCFNCWDDSQFATAAKLIAALDQSRSPLEVIYDWYTKGKIEDLTESGQEETSKDKLASNMEWLNSHDVHAAPALFLNGRRLAGGISIVDVLNNI
ncbi:MAG: cysteine peptidase family C39 domain-containing protein [Candidatus Cryptobacteroides sp.]|nr:cysteine peptidase family C39 domain-containing protein [Candidatus Cryptobacteroides sp.]